MYKLNGKVGETSVGKCTKTGETGKDEFPTLNLLRGRFQLAWVVKWPPGWALPGQLWWITLGWHRQARLHFGRESSTGRDGESRRHGLRLGHWEGSYWFAYSRWTVCAEHQRRGGWCLFVWLYLENGQWLEALRCRCFHRRLWFTKNK